ncbi:MAG: cytochrome c biogenesis CcdA family protein, partial [Acidimicrobiales bacterium]
MFDVDLAAPFALGLVAAFNPCGFAMLPTYLAYFIGLEDETDDQSVAGNVMRGLMVGGVMTLGFVAVFGTFGFATSHLVSRSLISEWLPWFTIIVGILMVPLGIAMLFGFELNLRMPRMNKGTGSRQLRSVFAFGVSYAVVSLGCTAPLFLIQVVGSFTREGV